MNKHGNIMHGHHGTLTYRRWKSMLQRCHTSSASNFKYYGGRGITVCERWRQSFEAFLADMGECQGGTMTLDRIDNSRGYEPGNCRWATMSDQNKNRSHNVALTFNGRTQIVSAWAAEIGISANLIRMRLRLGWSVERALTTPVKSRGGNADH